MVCVRKEMNELGYTFTIKKLSVGKVVIYKHLETNTRLNNPKKINEELWSLLVEYIKGNEESIIKYCDKIGILHSSMLLN